MTETLGLWQHQLEAVKRAAARREFYFAMAMGTGKTAATIHTLRQIYLRHRRLISTLILAPPITLRNWQVEFARFSRIPAEDIVVLSGPGAARLKAFNHSAFDGRTFRPRIFITNYESLLMPELFEAVFRYRPQVLVCDEIHRCKSTTAKRTKQAIKLGDLAEYRYGLSGTPVLNSPLDLWSQFRILDRGEALGEEYFKFRGKYFVDRNAFMPRNKYFPDFRLRPGAMDQITAQIAPMMMSVRKEDCLDLPPLVKKEIYVDLSPEQRRHYLAMKKDFITYLDDKACVAQLAITKGLRLMQIVSGFIPVEGLNADQASVRFKDLPRAVALRELLEELTPHHKVIVWAVFKEDYKTIEGVCRELKLDFAAVHGDVSAKAKDEAVERFRTDPRCRVFYGHPSSAGIGINLVEASYAIFYSRNFSLEQNEQAEARNYRAGSEQHTKVTRIDLVAKDTIDELVLEALKNKQAVGVDLLRKLR